MMMQLGSIKTYLSLLWGISVLFSMESVSDSIPETSSINSTAKLDKTTQQPGIARVDGDETVTWQTAVETTVPPTVKTEVPTVTDRSDISADLVVLTTVEATTRSLSQQWPHSSTAGTTATVGEAQPLNSTTISEKAKPTGDQLYQQSPTTSTGMTALATLPSTASAASSASVAVSTPQPKSTSTTETKITSKLSSSTYPADSTVAPVSTQNNLSSPSASTTTTMAAMSTSLATPKFEPTSSTVTVSEPSTITSSTELSSTTLRHSSTTAPISTSEFTNTTGSQSTAEPPANSIDKVITTTTTFSTSPAATSIPGVPKRSLIPSNKSTPEPQQVSTSPSSTTEVQPCSTRGVVKNCLIAIASLAGLSTFFMVCTIVLCTKLSTRKYNVRRPQPATEMMCISSLLPERSHSYTRQRNPVTNGVLVMHAAEDSDEDLGDNLTLSSFLPENDRYV